MVVPAELGHAQYAVEVLRFVCREFARVKICMFRSKLFPKLSENTYLLLAEERGKPCQWFSVSNHEDIDSVQASTHETPVDVESVRSGRVRLNRYLLSSKARQIYDSLSEQTDAVRLGNEADVGIGYVTGANDFFHLSEADARGVEDSAGLPQARHSFVGQARWNHCEEARLEWLER